MISQRVIDNSDFLKKLAQTRIPSKRKHLLISANTDQILAIVEICLNILKFRFPLTYVQKKRLIVHAQTLRKISRARSEKGARKILQKGEGLAVLAPLLIPVLTELASRLVSKLTK